MQIAAGDNVIAGVAISAINAELGGATESLR